MKAVLISIGIAFGILFSGCASDGMAINSIGGNKVDRYFKEGVIISQKKVIIDATLTATLTGAGTGALIGAMSGRNKKGVMVSSVIGGLVGAIVGKEVEAYETIILDENGNRYKGYLKNKIPNGSEVEFTIKDGKLKNVHLLSIR